MKLVTHYWNVRPSEQRMFKGAYQRGWNYSGKLDIPNHQGLDGNPFPSNHFRYDAWEDGYLDRAAGREYGHLLEQHDHSDCP